MSIVSLPIPPAALSRAVRPHPSVPDRAPNAPFVSAGLALLASYREVTSRSTSLPEQQGWVRRACSFRRLFDAAPAMNSDELIAAMVAVNSERARVRDHIDRQVARAMR